MVYRATAFRLVLLYCLLLQSGCVLQQLEVNALADSLHSRGAQYTLGQLEKITPKPRDRAQYLLNRGRLKSLAGDIGGSIDDLQAAKKIMASLQAVSVSENLSAATINETLRSYTGTPSERVMVHTLLAHNYLRRGSLDSARVEMLQADVTMQEIADADSLSGQLASAHFTSGLIYEINDEWDNAMISYRRAAKIMDKRQQSLPPALQDSLLQVSFRQGLEEEYEGYVERFNRKAIALDNGDAELIVIYADGNVSTIRQQTLSMYSPEHNQYLTVAIPYYPPANYRPQFFTVNVDGGYHRTHVLEDIEQLARDDLSDELPRITATALARAALKYNAITNAEKQNEFAQALVNVAAIFTESADMRSWNMLPSTLQIARIRLKQGDDTEPFIAAAGLNNDDVVSFNGGKKLLLLANSVK